MAPLLDVRAAEGCTNATFLEANCLWLAVGAKPEANGATTANTAKLENFIVKLLGQV
jgi:hypothetical protein